MFHDFSKNLLNIRRFQPSNTQHHMFNLLPEKSSSKSAPNTPNTINFLENWVAFPPEHFSNMNFIYILKFLHFYKTFFNFFKIFLLSPMGGCRPQTPCGTAVQVYPLTPPENFRLRHCHSIQYQNISHLRFDFTGSPINKAQIYSYNVAYVQKQFSKLMVIIIGNASYTIIMGKLNKA